MSKVLTDQIEKRTGGTAMDVPTSGKWPTTNIADDAVTLAKMAALARGKLIVGDSSGDPSALTVGTADQVLTSDGTDASWVALPSGGTTWQAVQTAAFTAVAGNGYPINTTSAAVTVTLPASASVGDTIEFIDYLRTWATNNLTINTNSLKYQGNATPLPVYDTEGESLRIVYADATQGWIPVFDGGVALETSQTYTVDWLVIGGGGSGGGCNGGGGGAGGYRNSYNSEPSGGGGSSETAAELEPGTVYTVTVGAGAAGQTNTSYGDNGSDSSIAGTGLTTITSAGGGGAGGDIGGGGRDGGSGGGAGQGTGSDPWTGGSGTANQGYDGGDSAASNNTTSGGGGAGAVGEDKQSSSVSGGGGDGVNSDISGATVQRGGGGGGSCAGGKTRGDGGAGGGGNGNTGTGTGDNGTANTGGGSGGGGTSGGDAGAGGSGVVVLRMLTTKYSGTTSGSPTVSTSGSDTIILFNASGSYTG